ncbi:MAG: ABC transporter ATP-binding protein [Nitrospira sp.]|nr:ABC transporter ATP-binding protein [Nitrospira sp.]
MNHDTFIQLQNISVVYTSQSLASICALEDFNLVVKEGEFLTIIGPSGCGKSTLLNILAGLQKPSQGEALIEGERIEAPRPDKVAMVFQEYTLFPWRTVLANVEVGLEFRGVSRQERREKALEEIKLVGLQGFEDRYPQELSGGMKQRVAIARALTIDPQILLMDEPFGALDEQTRLVLGEELMRIWEETRKTILFVTHSLSEAVYLSDRIVVMTARPGRIKEILKVDFPHPRRPEIMTTDAFEDLRIQLLKNLYEESRRAVLQGT